MRRFTASLLATTILAGGAATGVALAATPSHHGATKADARSVDRHGSADRQHSRDTARERASHDRLDR